MKSSRKTTRTSDSANDLTGKRFGKWCVLGTAQKRVRQGNGKTAWRTRLLCRCECGTERHIARFQLVHARTTQCSDCAKRQQCLHPGWDLTGKRFGKWLVLEFLRKKVHRADGEAIGAPMWLCRCDCGAERVIPRGNLVRKMSTQCSDCARDQNRKPNTRLYYMWRALRSKRFLCKEWMNFEAFQTAVGEPPHPRARLKRLDRQQIHRPGNSFWHLPGSESPLSQAQREHRERVVQESKILTKVRKAKTRAELIRYLIRAREAGFTYGQIGVAAGMTRQGIHQLVRQATE